MSPKVCRFSAAGNDEPLHALWRPAAEKRQGTKSRAMVQRRCRRRYGGFATGDGLGGVGGGALDDRVFCKEGEGGGGERGKGMGGGGSGGTPGGQTGVMA